MFPPLSGATTDSSDCPVQRLDYGWHSCEFGHLDRIILRTLCIAAPSWLPPQPRFRPPTIARGATASVLKFVPQADLAVLDPDLDHDLPDP